MQNKKIVFFSMFILACFALHGIVAPGTKVSVAYSLSDFDEEDITTSAIKETLVKTGKSQYS